eukprot:TRINITY_DN4540_c0_g1_i10.p1 TRINITY_DN4540_c0_g1~~TRINITY_DN4540_c0_g1_i10.p1  ORF type:complete len:646 (+),score=93.14 TRINITY_DN4540_c0_g1_i10:112-2049(+)
MGKMKSNNLDKPLSRSRVVSKHGSSTSHEASPHSRDASLGKEEPRGMKLNGVSLVTTNFYINQLNITKNEVKLTKGDNFEVGKTRMSPARPPSQMKNKKSFNAALHLNQNSIINELINRQKRTSNGAKTVELPMPNEETLNRSSKKKDLGDSAGRPFEFSPYKHNEKQLNSYINRFSLPSTEPKLGWSHRRTRSNVTSTSNHSRNSSKEKEKDLGRLDRSRNMGRGVPLTNIIMKPQMSSISENNSLQDIPKGNPLEESGNGIPKERNVVTSHGRPTNGRPPPLDPDVRPQSMEKVKLYNNYFKLSNLLAQDKKLPITAPKNRRTGSLDYGYKSRSVENSGRNTQRSVESEMTTTNNEGGLNIRYSVRTRTGVLPSNPNKVNQDSFVICPNFAQSASQHFFAVNDGHGTNGHLVSHFIKEKLPILLSNTTHLRTNPRIAVLVSYEMTHKSLYETSIDVNFSGSTSVSILIQNEKLYCANVGDSRAIMAGMSRTRWNVRPLSFDHKPTVKAEADRINKCGGRIEPFRDQEGNFIGPSRVWLRDDDIPGLAMTRSLGDAVAASAGVTWMPEILEFQIEKDDRFIVLATDGVWEFIESAECVQLVAPFYERNDLEGACDRLLAESQRRWREEEEVVVDDITLIIIFLR